MMHSPLSPLLRRNQGTIHYLDGDLVRHFPSARASSAHTAGPRVDVASFCRAARLSHSWARKARSKCTSPTHRPRPVLTHGCFARTPHHEQANDIGSVASPPARAGRVFQAAMAAARDVLTAALAAYPESADVMPNHPRVEFVAPRIRARLQLTFHLHPPRPNNGGLRTAPPYHGRRPAYRRNGAAEIMRPAASIRRRSGYRP
jgi:hypothetical protein